MLVYMATITLENLTKRFGEVVAVDDLNLDIRRKELVVLLGPSGCGKTTTLRLVAGLEFPTIGRVYVDGKDVTYVHPKDRKMSMVFQSYALYPHMTAFDNIAFPLKIQKRPKEEIRKRVKETAEVLKIEHLLKRKPKELSGGERQRVALGRAIIKEPTAFLMDEPLANVDARLRVHLRAELKRLQRELGITTIYVTHDQIEAMTMADRVAVINKGRLMEVSPPHELYDNPSTTFVADFIGTPPMNLIDCSLVEKNGGLFVDSGIFTIDASDFADILSGAQGSKLLLGVRPEDFSIGKRVKGKVNFTANVYALELLGTESVVTFEAGGKLFRAKVPASFRVDVGEKIGVSFDERKMHIFDEKTGKKLRFLEKSTRRGQ